MADKKTISIYSSIILLSLFLGGLGANTFIDNSKPLYTCDSTGKISDCINGVKADGVRCYWNATNTAKYVNCPEKWHTYSVPAITEEVKTTKPIENHVSVYEICNINGCTKVE